jgi:prophage regulatory protein
MTQIRVLIFDDLKSRGIRYSREHIRRRERARTFPLHIDLGEGRIGWIEREIDDWLAERAAQRNTEATA